jgi:predicted NAD/FAD-binding protein
VASSLDEDEVVLYRCSSLRRVAAARKEFTTLSSSNNYPCEDTIWCQDFSHPSFNRYSIPKQNPLKEGKVPAQIFYYFPK